ncbi:MAG: general secretion pathway protein GspB [Candidatus Azotimanducaceae bacterium]|uniref:Type II secretion system protein GspB C-terminal domain-containing protein n=1 Tax=OM182 bacterium TaxID=2510334 RepID=A0A520S4W6_9GAMM|nr:hypothetical protein [Gammaproteobacteria bacterium]OUV68309.1 MAG: hypothetical protein CBC93_02995 [Gammaproteobacteria bacterium TMED133]RZO77484.1 MAG: hypothetical protein EVA68_01125 [OM182 bacterium]
MSYILDALKKTEQAERNRQIPTLDTVQSISKESHNTWWPFWLAITFMIGTGIILQIDKLQHENAKNVNPLSEEAKFKPDIRESIVSIPLDKINHLPIPLSALPSNLKNQIPKMKFSSHIFSSDSSLRSVTINNQIYQEEDMLTDELYLQEISEDGIIVRYQGYLVQISFLDEWQTGKFTKN